MRLIDAKAVEKKMRELLRPCDIGFAIRAVREVPTVDAVPVVHGRWIKDWCDNNLIGHEYETCSNCGAEMLDTNQFWDCNYCPRCGAKMRGADE